MRSLHLRQIIQGLPPFIRTPLYLSIGLQEVQLPRGARDIQNPGLGLVTYGVESDALGIADIVPVSLGDGGEAVLTFPNPIMNGSGPRFCCFRERFCKSLHGIGLC